jgi:hypothetical protein
MVRLLPLFGFDEPQRQPFGELAAGHDLLRERDGRQAAFAD